MVEKCFLPILICDKKLMLLSDAAQNACHLIRACSFCPTISCAFPDDVTVMDNNAYSFLFLKYSILF